MASLAFKKGFIAVILFALFAPSLAYADGLWDDLWMNKSQQAVREINRAEDFEKGYKPEDEQQVKNLHTMYGKAGDLYENEAYKGYAYYKADMGMESAIAFTKDIEKNGKSVTSLYNLGNALAKIGDIDGAIEAYEEVLKMNPQSREQIFQDATFNRDYLKQLKEKQEQEKEQQQNKDNRDKDQNKQNNDKDKQDQDKQQDKDKQSANETSDGDKKKEESQQRQNRDENENGDKQQEKSSQDNDNGKGAKDMEQTSSETGDENDTAGQKTSDGAKENAGDKQGEKEDKGKGSGDDKGRGSAAKEAENQDKKASDETTKGGGLEPDGDEIDEQSPQWMNQIAEDKYRLIRARLNKMYNKKHSN